MPADGLLIDPVDAKSCTCWSHQSLLLALLAWRPQSGGLEALKVVTAPTKPTQEAGVAEEAVAQGAGVTIAAQMPAGTTPVASHRVLMAVDGPSTAIEGGRWPIDPLLWRGPNHPNVVDVPSTTKERGRCHIDYVRGDGGGPLRRTR